MNQSAPLPMGGAQFDTRRYGTVVENGYIYNVVLVLFIGFLWFIRLFAMLYKKDGRILCSDCLRLWYVYNE